MSLTSLELITTEIDAAEDDVDLMFEWLRESREMILVILDWQRVCAGRIREANKVVQPFTTSTNIRG